MNILIWTDLEGVSGIVDFDKHEPLSEKDKYQRLLMTGEVNAAIKACFDCGANKVKIIEGHDSIDFLTLDERALYVPARYPAVSKLQGWEGYDYMLLIGCHAMQGTKTGVLNHTGSHKAIAHRKINGQFIGEVGTAIYEAGEYGITALLVSGDKAVCDEAKAFSKGIFTAAVKVGYDQFHAECLHPNKARQLIYEKTCEAIKQKYLLKPIVIEDDVIYEEKYNDKKSIDSRCKHLFTKVINEHTIEYHGSSVINTHGRRCGLDIKEY